MPPNTDSHSDQRAGTAPVTVTLVLVPGFALHALALCVDTLRVANREALDTVFDWRIASESGDAVVSSAGLALPVDVCLSAISMSPVAIVLAAYEPERGFGDGLVRWLRRQQRGGALLGCVDTGAIVLARAGVAGRAPLSIHPLALDGAREDFPDMHFCAERVRVEPRRLSCTGGIATMDMMLALVERQRGTALATRVAQMLSHHRPAPGDERRPRDMLPAHPVLARCTDLMHTHVETPLPLAELSARCRVPAWTLRRLFARHLGSTPIAHYRGIRLARARQLLAYSHLSIAQIAAACGFADTATFSHAFTQAYGRSPSASRHDDPGVPRGRLSP